MDIVNFTHVHSYTWIMKTHFGRSNTIDKALTNLNKQEHKTQSSIDKISEVKSKL